GCSPGSSASGRWGRGLPGLRVDLALRLLLDPQPLHVDRADLHDRAGHIAAACEYLVEPGRHLADTRGKTDRMGELQILAMTVQVEQPCPARLGVHHQFAVAQRLPRPHVEEMETFYRRTGRRGIGRLPLLLA